MYIYYILSIKKTRYSQQPTAQINFSVFPFFPFFTKTTDTKNIQQIKTKRKKILLIFFKSFFSPSISFLHIKYIYFSSCKHTEKTVLFLIPFRNWTTTQQRDLYETTAD